MKKYGLNELRKMYLDFFESKGHLVLKSFSLVPHNDNSLLLINAGMAPLKPYFTGQEVPPRTRIATCQKCIRTGDIENVGKTARHGTFFEMLGNFSFGDYFKHEAIAWSWEFLTKVVGLDSQRLYPSVYLDDDEAFDIWNKEIGIPADRIFRFGKEDNFWEHGAGPCGPCSEIYYDRGEKYGCGEPGCTVGCECDRYMEVWNNVFTQFNNDGNGNYETLEHKNIDTGMGLERLAVVVQDVDSIFDVDTLCALRNKVCDFAKTVYKTDEKKDISIRVITDHIRSATFMISDGILPSNEGRGYVLRRLIRRAARHGRLLGIDGVFLAKLSETVIETSKDGYPELEEKKNMIFKVLTEEENKFHATLEQGLNILKKLEDALQEEKKTVLAGEDAFKLYDTYGFPLDLTIEILEEKGMTVDQDGFHKAMEIQRMTAKDAHTKTNYMGADATIYDQIPLDITSTFIGYDSLKKEADIAVLTKHNSDGSDEIVTELSQGEEGSIIVPQTPFYATMGGQEGDKGVIETATGKFLVKATRKVTGNRIAHIGEVKEGKLETGAKANLMVNEEIRKATGKNHSATHLLQKALRIVLGDHVEQAGSLVNESRLRFDFTHFQSMTQEEIEKTEKLVNEQIMAGLKVQTDIMSLEDAKKTGAMALFNEKYGEKVRVVRMGDFSVELCGGTHVSNTSEIGLFKILSESGIAAGVRRIEALTSMSVIEYYTKIENELKEAVRAAKCEEGNLVSKIQAFQDEVKELHNENEKLKNKLATESMGDITDKVVDIQGTKFLVANIPDLDMNGLRNLGDQAKDKLGDCVVLLASSQGNDKVQLIAMATDSEIKKGAHAGNLIKAVAGFVGGGGGGRPNMAQAGGKKPDGIEKALENAKIVLSEQLTK